jgi:ubiquinone/menaquinone biosynthesis C-methylase UbiE
MSESKATEFWDSRYLAGKIPWDFGGVPEAVPRFLASENAPLSVLIPGCGLAHEVEAFSRSGWNVIAIDFSSAAVAAARKRLGPLANRVVEGDFFTHNFPDPKFDLVYERTFLCALPPRLRSAYARRVAELLKPEGRLIGFFYCDEVEDPDGPPFPIIQEELALLLKPYFQLVADQSVRDSQPLFAGKERWQIWKRAGPQHGGALLATADQ